MSEQKFKIGDRVRVMDGVAMWAGICGTVVCLHRDGWIVIQPDEGSRYTDGSHILDGYRERANMNPNHLELIDTATPPQEAKKFKIGDRVRVKDGVGLWAGICGTVVNPDHDGLIAFRPDEGSRYTDGSLIIEICRNYTAMYHENLELIDTATQPQETPTFDDWQLTTLSHRQRSNDPTAPLMTLTLKVNSFAEIKAAFLSAADVLGYGE